MKKVKHDDEYSHILKYTGMFGGVQGGNVLLSLVKNKLVALILGPEGLGLISLFNSVIKFVSDSTTMGLSMSSVRELSVAFRQNEKIGEKVEMVRMWSLMVALWGTVICIVLSPWLDTFVFAKEGHMIHFVLLSPVVFLMAIVCGEIAVLKATQQLKYLALQSIEYSGAALLIATPLYYIWGQKAIVPSLLFLAVAQWLLVVIRSYRLFPLKISLRKRFLTEGYGMMRLGLVFVVATSIGSGTELILRSYLEHHGGLNVVGLYNAGYMLTMTCAGVVLSALETDYFPRLSGVQSQLEFCELVNRQIEMCILLLAPLLALLLLFLPILIPLLYSRGFLLATDMTRLLIVAVLVRGFYLPLEYIPLAKGDSVSYLIIELSYSIVLVPSMIFFQNQFDITGVGIALLFSSIIILLFDLLYCYWKYDYLPDENVIKIFMVYLFLLSVMCGIIFLYEDFIEIVLSTVIMIVISISSIKTLSKKVHAINDILKKCRLKCK